MNGQENRDIPINREEQFSYWMNLGVVAHNEGDHGAALVFRQQADKFADTDIQKGRVWRDIAASYYKGAYEEDYGEGVYREGFGENSRVWIEESIAILRGATGRNIEGARRELGASYDWLGRVSLKGAILRAKSGEDVSDEFNLADSQLSNALADLPKIKGEKIDQYRINTLPAAALARVLAGNGKSGMKLAWKSLKAARWSESPRLETSSAGMNRKERLRSKTKVVARSVGVLGVAATSVFSGNAALKLADKLI